MLKKLKRFLPVLALVFLLASCDQPLNTKQQVREDLKSLQQISATQQTALTALESAGQSESVTYLKIQEQYPDKNLLEVSTTKMAQATAKRADAYQTLKDQQKALKPVAQRLLKVAKQDNADLPTEAIKDLNQSIKISTLDYATLSNFYQAAVTAEADFYADHQDADADPTDLESPINRLNQFYSSVYQQAEIAKVNINTVTAQLKKVQTGLK